MTLSSIPDATSAGGLGAFRHISDTSAQPQSHLTFEVGFSTLLNRQSSKETRIIALEIVVPELVAWGCHQEMVSAACLAIQRKSVERIRGSASPSPFTSANGGSFSRADSLVWFREST